MQPPTCSPRPSAGTWRFNPHRASRLDATVQRLEARQRRGQVSILTEPLDSMQPGSASLTARELEVVSILTEPLDSMQRLLVVRPDRAAQGFNPHRASRLDATGRAGAESAGDGGFNPHRASRLDATSVSGSAIAVWSKFQSSPSLSTRCNNSTSPLWTMDDVSILTEPLDSMQRAG